MRKFAFWNIIVWTANLPIVFAWYLFAHQSFVNGAGILYVAQISVVANWLSAITWHAAERTKDSELTVDQIVAETNVEPA